MIHPPLSQFVIYLLTYYQHLSNLEFACVTSVHSDLKFVHTTLIIPVAVNLKLCIRVGTSVVHKAPVEAYLKENSLHDNICIVFFTEVLQLVQLTLHATCWSVVDHTRRCVSMWTPLTDISSPFAKTYFLQQQKKKTVSPPHTISLKT